MTEMKPKYCITVICFVCLVAQILSLQDGIHRSIFLALLLQLQYIFNQFLMVCIRNFNGILRLGMN